MVRAATRILQVMPRVAVVFEDDLFVKAALIGIHAIGSFR
jgi:hypothetical protein